MCDNCRMGQAQDLSWKGVLQTILQRKMLAMLALGFGCGLPFFLVFDTLSAWLRGEGLSLERIAFFSLATLAFAFKFLWAPFLDRTGVPGLTALLGHRRSWVLVCQGAIIAGLALITLADPNANLGAVAVVAVVTGFAAASQDIVVDAWRIEVSAETEQGAMAAAHAWGYRGAMVIAGALPLLMADAYGWTVAYVAMALLMTIAVIGALLAPREPVHTVRPLPGNDLPYRPGAEYGEWIARLAVLVIGALVLGSGLSGQLAVLNALLPEASRATLKAIWTLPVQFVAILIGFGIIVLAAAPLPNVKTRPGLYLSHAFGDPLADFFSRFKDSALLILALICLYRLSDFVLNIMNPYYLDLGFTLTEIAEVRKIFGVVMSLLGVASAGFAIARWGLMGPLIVGAFGGPLSNLTFAWLTVKGAQLPALFVAIGIDNIAGGFSGTCLIAYMSSLTAQGFTATQYALFTSLYALPGKFIASLSGRIVEGSARAAETGGFASSLKSLLAGLPPEALASGAAKAGVSPAALGAGYMVYFFYSAAVGTAAIVLVFIVAKKRVADSNK
jgi:PAT family beta-lactamase induction signal transducer AmpG